MKYPMSNLKGNEKGQIAILIAFLIVGLVGALALAVDGSMIMLDRRNAQAAADQAALAGSYAAAKYYGSPLATRTTYVQNAAIARAADNGFTITAADVQYPISGSYHLVGTDTETQHYVRVTINSQVQPSFLRVIGFTAPIVNHIQSIAHINPEVLSAEYGMIALAPQECESLAIGNSSDILVVNGSILVNSNGNNGTCPATDLKTGTVTVDSDQTIVIVGAKGSGDDFVPPSNTYDQQSGAAINFPGDFLTSPPFPPSSQGFCTSNYTLTTENVTRHGVSNLTRIYPGNNVPANINNVYMEPGVYCFTSGFNPGNGNIVGDNVMLYIYDEDVTITGSPRFILSAPLSGPYKGILFFQDPMGFDPADYGECSFTFTGASTSELYGTFYAPVCNMILTGSMGNMFYSQVLAYTITKTGSGVFNVNNLSGSNYQGIIILPNSLDLSQ